MVGMIEAGVVELGPLENLIDAVGQILLGLKQILTVVASEVFSAPVLPVLVWSLFWLFAVDWTRLRQIILKGGWLGGGLGGVVMVIIWQQVVPESEVVLGLKVNGYIEKMVYVTALFTVMFVCGAIQLTGCCARCCPAPVTEPDAGHDH